MSGAALAAAVCCYSYVAYEINRRVPEGFRLSGPPSVAWSNGGFAVRAVLFPRGAILTGRTVITLREVAVEGGLWPPLADCAARASGLSMRVGAFHPSSAVAAFTHLDRISGRWCASLAADSGEIIVDEGGVAPVTHLSLERAVWRGEDRTMEAAIDRLDGRPTRITFRSAGAGDTEIRTIGEWNLAGLDVTPLLARAGIQWSSRADVGVLEFETSGDDSREWGRFRISGWALTGADPARPFRLSAPSVTADFTACGGELLLRNLRIERPSYDLVGADPQLMRLFLAQGPSVWMTKQKWKSPNVNVSPRHSARVESLPPEFAVRVESLRIDSGAAFLIDRRERTQFVLKAADISVNMTGPAPILGRTPNTFIRFRMNDRRIMRWEAITDFSTWPPQFRLTDVQ